MKAPDPMKSPGIQFCLLGPLQVRRGLDQVTIGAHKQRLLLATLLCRANTVMSVDHLIEAIWEDAPPRTVRKNLQAYISTLRKVIGDRLVHTPYGYSIRCGSGELDILRFDEAATTGREAARSGDHAAAATAFAEALALWRGPFLADVPHSAFLAATAARLAERRLRLCEDWSEAALALGDHREVLDVIDDMAAAHPERERLTIAKLIALCRCGRRTEALAYYEFIRVSLARDLGLDPSPQLQLIFQAMLSGDPVGIDAGQARAEAARPPGASPLPRDIADFTGRAREIGLLTEALAAGSDSGVALLVTGPVGTGKTALAVHVAHLAATRFADGQVLAAMRDARRRPRPLANVLTELAATLGFDIGDATAPDATAAWRAWLSRRNVLIILDDAREEPVVRALLPGRGPSRVVVTSRYRLGGIESVTRVDLGAFDRAEAAELTAKIAGFGAVLGRLPEIAAAIDRCGRLPLAVRILAGRLRERGHPPLRVGEDVLGQLVLGDLSLARRYREHLSELPEDERHVLGTLVLSMSPPYGAAAIAEVMTAFGVSGAHIVESLVEANLLLPASDEVTAHSDQYVMPALAYDCARSVLVAKGVIGT